MLKLKLGNLALVSALAFVPTGTIGTYTGNQAEKLVFEISKEQGENIEFKTKLEIAKDILNEAEEIKQKRMLEEINKSLKESEELKRKEEEAKQELNKTFVLTFNTQ